MFDSPNDFWKALKRLFEEIFSMSSSLYAFTCTLRKQMMEIHILQIYISLYSLLNVTHFFLLLKEISSLLLQAPATSYFIASFEHAQRASLI